MKHLSAPKHFNLHINGGILGMTGRLAFHFSKNCLLTRLCVCMCVCVQDLGVTASVVKPKRGLHGLRIGAGFIQRLCIVDLVVLHLWVQLAELLVALGSAAEVLDVVVAEAEQGERRPRLRGRRQIGCKQFEMMLMSSIFEGHFRKYGNYIINRKVDVIKKEIIIRCRAFNY